MIHSNVLSKPWLSLWHSKSHHWTFPSGGSLNENCPPEAHVFELSWWCSWGGSETFRKWSYAGGSGSLQVAIGSIASSHFQSVSGVSLSLFLPPSLSPLSLSLSRPPSLSLYLSLFFSLSLPPSSCPSLPSSLPPSALPSPLSLSPSLSPSYVNRKMCSSQLASWPCHHAPPFLPGKTLSHWN